MDSDSWIMVAIYGVIFVVVVSFGGILTCFQAYNEAKVFNKFTIGPKATTWDALFAELRIDARSTKETY